MAQSIDPGSGGPGFLPRRGSTGPPGDRGAPATGPAIQLPKGGGAIRGIDESFAVNPVTGTARLTFGLPVSRGRSDATPALELAYDSGAGQGVFGVGWSLHLPGVVCKTDKRLPEYAGDDTYVLGGDELVPTGSRRTGNDAGRSYVIEGFRPRVEAAYARIERWSDRIHGGVHWRSATADNVTSVYGRSEAARVADPEHPERVFEWLLEETRDDRGEVIAYVYVPEDGAGVDVTAPQEAPRVRAGTFAQRHLKRIRYANRVPDVAAGWLLEIVLDYGDHDDPTPGPDPDRPWPVRRDPFSAYRPGFEVRTYRLCRRLLFFHRFDELGPAPRLVRSMRLTYAEDPVLSKLVAVQRVGHIEGDAVSLPPVELRYTAAQLDPTVRTLDAASLEHLGVDGPPAPETWIDLDGDGVPGRLTEDDGVWHYKPNLGGGRIGPRRRVREKPLGAVLAGARQLVDLDGDGVADVVGAGGLHARLPDGGWTGLRPFRALPTGGTTQPDARIVDLDGDGRGDLAVAGEATVRWHPALGADGFGLPRDARPPRESGGAVPLADLTQTLRLADMSGDGMTDLVRIRNGEISYWPHLGHGRFGAKVTMDRPPWFDDPEAFDPARLRLVDIDGSGLTDVLYAGRDGVAFWVNEAGNGWGARQTIPTVPPVDDLAELDALDFLGTGTACLVWSTTAPAVDGRRLRYVDLLGGRKPHLLCGIANNLGQERLLEYAPSTEFLLADRRAGREWRTRLPFPVHVVRRTEVVDHVSETTLVSRHRYRDGYFDAYEREFRGFAYSEHEDAETHRDEDLPAVLTRTWTHVGAEAGPDVSGSFAGNPPAPGAPAVVLPNTASPDERREVLRSLRGSILREEVLARDGSDDEDIPYTVTTTGYRVRPLPAAPGQWCFAAERRERLTITYERRAGDPRVAHELVLATDDFGHPTRTASVAYPRRSAGQPGQAVISLTVSEEDLRNDSTTTDRYRLGIPIESRTYDVTGVRPAGAVFTPDELDTALSTAPAIAFHESPAPGASARRLVERTVTLYLRDDLGAALPLGSAGRRGLVHRTLRAALTPELVQRLYGPDVPDTALSGEGGYELRDGLWWIPSTRGVPDPARFFRITATVDPFGNRSETELDAYSLLPVASEDALGNRTIARNSYRVLAPWLVTDPNGNRTGVRYDALGFVTATAAMGKAGAGEGDTLDETSSEAQPDDAPTSVITYDVDAFVDRGEPVSVRTRTRERHGLPNSRWFETRAFYDGSGRDVMTKTRAEPGLAPARLPDGSLELDPAGRPVLRDTPTRWVGSGRTAYDNKGNAVRRFEPFFSTSAAFETEAELALHGALVTLRHDPLGRLARTERADGTFSLVRRDAWTEEAWDENDTVLDSSWYLLRAAAPAGSPERRTAELTARHSGTPSVMHLDPRGRAVVNVAHAGRDAAGAPLLLATRTTYDAEGGVETVVDPRGITAVRHEYDMAGRTVRQAFADAGAERVLAAADGARMRTWSATGHRSEFAYDALRRALTQTVSGPDGRRVTERTEYGETLGAAAPARNLRGRRLQTWDAAGLETVVQVDFRGNVLEAARRYVVDHRVRPDWQASGPALEAETFTTRTSYDALDRVTEVVTPDGTAVRTTYDRGGQIAAVAARLRGGGAWVSLLDEATYDARGRRARAVRGTVVTVYRYEPETGRLVGLRTMSGNAVLQDLSYTHDPVGNVLQVDDAAQQSVFFRNGVAPAGARFELDPVYRLVIAEGREHEALSGTPQYDHDDAVRCGLAHPHDSTALLRYAEAYSYDDGGNLTELVHHQGGPTGPVLWRRRHRVATDSNRLLSVSLPGDGVGPLPVRFAYDAAGAVAQAPHMDEVRCDHRSHLEFARRGTQALWLADDASGRRARKVVEGNGGAIVEDRRYVGGWEVMRRRTAAGVEAERETLRVTSGDRCVAQIDTETVRAGAPVTAPQPAVRLQHHDHLLSSVLELDIAGDVLTYEEHHPYGGTAYQGGRSVAETSLKRYRFLGRERDELTGFVACAARPYAPWLARFLFPDPAGLADGPNLYRYARGNPTRFPDPAGTQTPVATFPTLTEGLRAFERMAEAADVEIGLARDTISRELRLFSGGSKQVDMGPTSNTRIAHSHILDATSTPSDADLVTIRDQVRAGGPREHLIVKPGMERTLVTASRDGAQMRSVTFDANGGVRVSAQVEQPWQVGTRTGEFSAQGPTVRLGRVAGVIERVKAELRGGALGAAAAKTGSALRTGVLAVGKGLAVVGAAMGGVQVGTGINQMFDRRTRTEGAINAGEGAANLGLSIGVAIAVKAKVLVAEAGIVAGGTAALAGVAAAGSVTLLAETARAAVKGEMTPIDVADKYYGTKLGDLTSYLPSSFMDKVHNAYYEAFLK